MTIWRIIKLYSESNQGRYYVLPYNLRGTVHTIARMNCGLKMKLRLFRYYRITERAAELTAKRWNERLEILEKGIKQAKDDESMTVEGAFKEIRTRTMLH